MFWSGVILISCQLPGYLKPVPSFW